jgi:hypothetical protein
MLILAGNRIEADNYTQAAHYLKNTNDIKGFCDTTLLLVGTWFDREDIDKTEIINYCKAHNITIRDTNTLTDIERIIVDREYKRGKKALKRLYVPEIKHDDPYEVHKQIKGSPDAPPPTEAVKP